MAYCSRCGAMLPNPTSICPRCDPAARPASGPGNPAPAFAPAYTGPTAPPAGIHPIALVILGLVVLPLLYGAFNVSKLVVNPNIHEVKLFFIPVSKPVFLIYYTSLSLLTLGCAVGLLFRLKPAWMGLLALKLLFIPLGLINLFQMFTVFSHFPSFSPQLLLVFFMPVLYLLLDGVVVALLVIFRRNLVE